MGLTVIAFYLFAAVAVGSGLLMVLARNPVHSVLWLVLTFFSVAGLMVLMGAEFIAMLLIIVYVGAVMLLFLFIVMMLDVDFADLRRGSVKYLPLGGLIGLVLLVELGMIFGHWVFATAAPEARAAGMPALFEIPNAQALGGVLYDDFVLVFQIAGLILLVAMIGAVVLTLRQRQEVKNRDAVPAFYRGRDVDLREIKPGQRF